MVTSKWHHLIAAAREARSGDARTPAGGSAERSIEGTRSHPGGISYYSHHSPGGLDPARCCIEAALRGRVEILLRLAGVYQCQWCEHLLRPPGYVRLQGPGYWQRARGGDRSRYCASSKELWRKA